METIYIDRLFLINLIIDYLILLISARVGGQRLRRVRFLLAAVFGALYAALSIVPGLEFLRLMPFKLSAGLLMALIAFSREEKFFRSALVFFGVSAAFGGAVWVLGGGGDGLTVSLSLPVLALSFGISYALMSLVFNRSVKNAERQISEVSVTHSGKSISLRALRDSGNGLFDPISGSAVLICPGKLLCPLFPENAELIRKGDAAEIVSFFVGESFRLIPYSAVGTPSGLMAAFRPDSLTLDGKPKDDVIIAVSPNDTTGDGFDCIL